MKQKATCSPKNGTDTKATRRQFLAKGPLLGGACLAALKDVQAARKTRPRPGWAIQTSGAENFIYTTCLQCNTGCEIKVRIQDGLAVKIEGNPYGPRPMDPHIEWTTPVKQVARLKGAICPKGQAGVQTAYDPYRIRRVLKRAGARGEGKWETISFEQAVAEIVEGGVLFPQDGGRVVTGLRDLWKLRDPDLAKAMGEDVKHIHKGEMTVEEFKQKYADHLDVLIDPDHPDLGPVNNQLAFMYGRLKSGRKEFFQRFVQDSFGSVNFHGHTTVCQGSIYFAGKAMSDQPSGAKFDGGKKAYWQGDTTHAEFIIFWGANVFDANYGPPLRVPKLTRAIAGGRMKIAVVDPRYSKAASKAWKYVPIRPGEDAALALGMIRWILENERYDARYLQNCNKAAAVADGEPTWSNGAWLVKIREDGSAGAFLRAPEAGLGGDADTFVALQNGRPVTFKSDDTENPVEGDLFVDTEINGIRVKSVLQLLWEEASVRTIEQWAAQAGVKPEDVVELADEFTSHGKRAVVDIHRGVSQHTNGFYNVLATMCALNVLIGNLDWKGGLVYSAGGFGITSGAFVVSAHPAKIKPFGINMIRAGFKYEETTLFEGYPAKRPWYPLSSDIYQEIIPSARDAYPYPIKALFLYMGSPTYALPAGHTTIETLSDPDKIPLIVASDIVIGETSMYADYIFPDLSYLERWEFQGSHPSVVHKVEPVRQPAIPSPNETVEVFGERMPISIEALLLAIAERLGMPGFGPGGLVDYDLNRPEDLYLRMVANIAHGGKADGSAICPDADDEELAIFLQARSHLPPEMFDAEVWEQIVGPGWWRKVVYVLNRGGRWASYDSGWNGDYVGKPYGKLVNLYSEKAATLHNSMTGEYLKGLPTYLPIRDSLGRPLEQSIPAQLRGVARGPLRLVTNRTILHTKSRTVADYWLNAIQPENVINMNKLDARNLGLRENDIVRVVSRSNPEGVWPLRAGGTKPLTARVHISYHIRPGVIAFDLGYGHFAYGSRDVVIDGVTYPGDPRRGRGIHANAAMYVDTYLDSPLSDVVGGSAVFYDSEVYLIKEGHAAASA
ncbi:MAG: molybdopterin-dependent oxidoreductase [Acidobacteriota bacterium]